ncbi:hypothetical protein NBRC10513_005475 [Rhodotorula toruloides]|uniref:Proteophosphoglycan ppg4 n=1 Tax=Rhodotorula toruloides TaxID=5286 RepID=A0A0K3CQC2_RHOTO|nr:hypothetical protein AAT19DRAFT_11089 [Rhodotorula toruloides]
MPARSRRSRRSTLALGCSFVLFAVAGARADSSREVDGRSEAIDGVAGRTGEVGAEGTMGGFAAAADGLSTSAAVEEMEKSVLNGRAERQRPRTIAITSSLPSADSLSPAFAATYDSLFESLASDAKTLVSSATSSLSSRLRGIPGTAITSSSEARDLQSFLDCSSSSGLWVYDASGSWIASQGRGVTVHKQESRYAACDKRFYKGREPGSAADEVEGGWDVRESLKWRWAPSPSCANLAPASLSPSLRSSDPPSRSRFCRLLAHKSTLLLGDSTQYSLHDLLLDWTTTEPQSCYGDLYCKEHALCGEILRSRKGEGVEDWEGDERVYHRLPLPPGGEGLSKREEETVTEEVEKRDSIPSSASHDSTLHPHTHDKRQSSTRSPSYGTLLRYRRTDGLRPSSAQTLPTYAHPSTGVREVNQQWLADSRRSDIVILNKPPLPLPRKGFNESWDEWVRGVLEDERVESEQEALRIVEAAAETTRNVWVAELVEALRAIRAPPSPPDQLVVYRGGWRQHADCAASSVKSDTDADELPTSPGDGPPPRSSQPSLSDLLFRPDNSLLPAHIIYHNAQLFFQNHLARRVVLPAFGVPFLDLDSPLSVWRSGMVGSSSASPFSSLSSSHDAQTLLAGSGKGLRSPTSGDCTRYCFPSPGLSLETFFLGALGHVFEAGWAGDEERAGEWMGGEEGFRNLRERVAGREARAE